MMQQQQKQKPLAAQRSKTGAAFPTKRQELIVALLAFPAAALMLFICIVKSQRGEGMGWETPFNLAVSSALCVRYWSRVIRGYREWRGQNPDL